MARWRQQQQHGAEAVPTDCLDVSEEEHQQHRLASQVQWDDVVVVYHGDRRYHFVTMRPGQVIHNKNGVFPHEEIVGQEYGSRIFESRRNTGWLRVLRPSPSLWNVALTHRTQVLYTPDVSMVIQGLELAPGSVVLESGTGTGCLTHYLARAVRPHGHVWTYEFHAGRAGMARDDFAMLGISDVVTVTHRDIMRGVQFDDSPRGVDAVFLDLPSPWLTIDSAAAALRRDGVLCSFSPCIEQVQRACDAMRQGGFSSLRTIEVILREFVPNQDMQLGRSDPNPPDDHVFCYTPQRKRRRVAGDDSDGDGDDGNAGETEDKGRVDATQPPPPQQQQQQQDSSKSIRPAAAPSNPHQTAPIWARSVSDARGHTGFLTFARRDHRPARRRTGVSADPPDAPAEVAVPADS